MRNPMPITAVILTFNEEIHIERCISALRPVTERIIVIDSFSTDRTTDIARSIGAEIMTHEFKNQADQFQWGLDNCQIETEWIMRMDADEYPEPELERELIQTLSKVASDVDGIYFKRKHFFNGKWIRFGGIYPLFLLRLWRAGKGRVEQRWMDEHIVLPPGSKTIVMRNSIVDDNIKGISFWVEKHNAYASREAAELLNSKYRIFDVDSAISKFGNPQAARRRFAKNMVYSRMPLGVRAALYFFYRYIIRLGFLDGGRGFIYHFLQGFWYRLLVDIKVMEIERKSKGNVRLIKKILRDEHGIQL